MEDFTQDNDENPHDLLLNELKNLNKDLKTELKNTKNKDDEEFITMVTPCNTTTTTPSATPLTEDNLGDYILDRTQELIKISLDTVSSMKQYFAGGATASEIEAFSELIKATTASIDTLNHINIEKKKSKTAKELKQMDIEGKKELTAVKTPSNVNVLMTTREEIMKMIEENSSELEKLDQRPAIDADFIDTTNKVEA